MPAILQPGTTITTYFHALDIGSDVMSALESNEKAANVILPQILKAREAEQQGQTLAECQVWIVCTSNHPRRRVEFILSCTAGLVGTYPIFIFTTLLPSQLTEEYVEPRLRELAIELQDAVPVDRVYSIFAQHSIAQIFADVWTELTGIKSYADPYYDSTMSYCTRSSFINRSMTMLSDFVFDLRPAVPSDIPQIAPLGFGFASESAPFFLTPQAALREMTLLVQNQLIWVHHIRRRDDATSGIASIVAFTRNSETNATITKVYTNPDWRRLGCAERLVRRVTRELLRTKNTVTLYVGIGNPAAKVYHRVGFVGLDTESGPIEGVENWTEIGFDRSKAQLGHW